MSLTDDVTFAEKRSRKEAPPSGALLWELLCVSTLSECFCPSLFLYKAEACSTTNRPIVFSWWIKEAACSHRFLGTSHLHVSVILSASAGVLLLGSEGQRQNSVTAAPKVGRDSPVSGVDHFKEERGTIGTQEHRNSSIINLKLMRQFVV